MRIGQGTRRRLPLGKALLRRRPFLVACTVVGTLLAGVVMLARSPIYQAQAYIQYDPQRYGFAVQQDEAGPVLNPRLEAEARDLWSLAGLQIAPRTEQAPIFAVGDEGVLVAAGQAADPLRAGEIADQGANALVRAMRSLNGWNLLRTLLRREIALQASGQPEPATVLTPHLFALLDAGFLGYDPTIPVTPAPPALFAQDVEDVIQAVELMHQRYTRRVSLLFEKLDRLSDAAERVQVEAEISWVTQQREELGRTLITLYRQGDALIQDHGGAELPQVQPAGPPQNPVGLPRWLYAVAGCAAGFLLGAALAWLDESMALLERLREIQRYTDLIWNLVLRDLKARYKNSILGYLWSLVNPLLLMIVFTVLFKWLLKTTIPNFPVFVIVGLLPWNFCATSVSGSVVSITGQSALIKKVYFPREVMPIAVVISNLINYLLALPAMVLIMLLLNAHFQPVALLFPVVVLIQTVFLLGLALLLSSLNVFFRDTQVIMEVLLTAWFFLTPVFYRLSDIVDERLARLVRWLNPMASLVDFYRDIFYLGGMPGLDALVRTMATAFLVLLVGYLFFIRLSPRFGEEV